MKILSIPTPMKNFVSNPRMAEFAENTFISLSVQTGLKMLGRPGFIVVDKKADSKTKKYAAVKEFSYQAICFGLYLAVVPPVKKGFYKLLTKNLSAKSEENKLNIDSYNEHKHKIEDLYKAMKSQIKQTKDKAKKSQLHEELLNKMNTLKSEIKQNPKFHLGKGATELSAITASILILAGLAPQIGTYLIHPTMKALGLEKKTKNDRIKHTQLNKGA